MRLIDWILAAIAGLWAAEGCFGEQLKGRVTDQAGASQSYEIVLKGSTTMDSQLSAASVVRSINETERRSTRPATY